MPISPEPKPEHPSTYLVQDRTNQDELNRLRIQDHMFTAGMGGVLPEQPDPTAFSRVLDVGCGTGGWLIELAQTTPTCTLLVGVDASLTFVQDARAHAAAARVSDRVEFHVADALRMLEFPTNSFDLVNQRGGMSWLRTWDWAKLLSEYVRVVHRGGVIRITETENVESSSPAFNRFGGLLTRALCQAGYNFRPDGVGVSSELAPLLSKHGIQQVQTRTYGLQYRAGTSEWQSFFEDARRFFTTYVPFLRKWIHVPDDYTEMCQQALHEMQQPDFVATWKLVTVWGHAPFSKNQPGDAHPNL
jgi:ubiquinone/menaquinone biosynthesis C-methylase UbiE